MFKQININKVKKKYCELLFTTRADSVHIPETSGLPLQCYYLCEWNHGSQDQFLL